MKRAHTLVLIVAALSAVLALAASLLLDAPRRPRPEGWRAPWEGLPLVKEGEWAVDATKRGVVQGEFFLVTDELSQCVRKHGGEDAEVKLELLVETERGGTHFEYVDAQPGHHAPRALVSCVTRSLESADPLPTPSLPEGTRWRLEVTFLVPPLKELPQVPWWKRLLPERWRSGSKTPHVG